MTVTLKRRIWSCIALQAAGHAREGGGLLLGRHTAKGNLHVLHEVALTHKEADEDHIRYDYDEVARARLAAYAIYKPQEVVGAWHSHPWSKYVVDVLVPQLSDEDKAEMLDDEVELVVCTFPRPEKLPATNSMILQRIIGKTVCRAEVWHKHDGEATACEVRLR